MQPRVVLGSFLSAEVVEALLCALFETLSRRSRPRVIVVREGVVWSVVPVPERRIRHRESAHVPVP